MPTITEDELNRLEHLIGKASNLPWANTDTAKELLNVQPDDWWKIYALNGPEEKRCPYHVVCSMSQRATIREQRSALIAWQFQAAGAALALQRLMDAAQAMREAQTAFERLVLADDHESISAVLRRAANTMGDAEDAFDDLLAAYRREMNFVK